jgi:Na+/phosphate symporter
MFRLFKRIMMENSGEVIKKLREKFEPQIVPMMMEFFKHADTSKIGLTAPELMQVMKWIDTAVDVEAMSEITSKTTAEDLREIYKKKMELVRKLLKHGIYK